MRLLCTLTLLPEVITCPYLPESCFSLVQQSVPPRERLLVHPQYRHLAGQLPHPLALRVRVSSQHLLQVLGGNASVLIIRGIQDHKGRGGNTSVLFIQGKTKLQQV